MGIESDRLVYDYLSRVGDVAQQRQLPSATRMRLVTELRGEIDRRRAKAMGDGPATVRRILDRLGSPDAVVAAAGGSVPVQRAAPDAPPAAPAVPAAQAPAAQAPADRAPGAAEPSRPSPEGPPEPVPPAPQGSRLWGLRKSVPKQREDDATAAGDWWRVDPVAGPDEVPGFTGGVEIPEMLKPPPRERDRDAGAGADAVVPPEPGVAVPAAAPAGRRFAWLPRGRRGAGGGAGLGSPVLLAAALALVAGAVMGQLLPLALGWLIVWGSRRLGPGGTRWALVVMPGLAVAGGVVWLWGRARGHWGAPVPDGELAAALAETGPWVLRAAAVLTAAYVLRRTRRPA
ncbi:hypothetical protein [Streptomyces fragilis]|uniref:Integral membrane protein n=1 Tax=Streptomyces fragilis TaxID=67301 RepID=A0ABV2YCW5_9ACTN|nr:hypothetical protein [Streptomyces fragilis]